MSVHSNWWENFFEGVAVDLWLQAVTPEHTEREADFLASTLAVPSGAELLDVPCGAGRLSLALAQRGYQVTGVDWSVDGPPQSPRWPPSDAERALFERVRAWRAGAEHG